MGGVVWVWRERVCVRDREGGKGRTCGGGEGAGEERVNVWSLCRGFCVVVCVVGWGEVGGRVGLGGMWRSEGGWVRRGPRAEGEPAVPTPRRTFPCQPPAQPCPPHLSCCPPRPPPPIPCPPRSFYVPAQSFPGSSQYLFAYSIRITNEGQSTVQLKNRWALQWLAGGPGALWGGQ